MQLLTEAKFNTIYRKYYRAGVEDSALTQTKDRLAKLYQKYGYGDEAPKSKVHYRKNAPQGFNEELTEIMSDFVEDENKFIGKTSFYNEKSYKVFMQRQAQLDEPEVTTPQEYIDYIEAQRDFRDQVFDLASLSSNQIQDIFNAGKESGLDESQVTEIATKLAEKMKRIGMNIDQLAQLIRTVASATTPKQFETLDYDAIVNAINEGKYNK